MDDKLLREKKLSWMQRRTKIEKCLFVLTGLGVVVIIYLASNLLMTFPQTRENLQQDVCLTEKCILSAADIIKNLDETVDPCDDFYNFVCGNFVKNAIIPVGENSVSSITDLSDKVTLQFYNILQQPKRDDEPYSLKILKAVYNSCMNKKQIEEEGLTYLKNEFKNLGGWPVVEPYWNEKNFDWTSLLSRLREGEWISSFFFYANERIDHKNSSRLIYSIGQPYLSEALKKGFNDTAVRAMYHRMVEFAVLFGADRATAISDMKNVIDFQIEFAKLIGPHVAPKNKSLNYNPTIRELQKMYPSFPWLKLINNYLSPIATLTSDDVIHVQQPEFFERLENFLPKIKKRTLANYMFSTVLGQFVNYLPEEFERKDLKYLKDIYGRYNSRPRWSYCVWESTRLHVAMSYVHIKHLFDKRIKHKVTELIADVKNSFFETLKSVDWMDRETKNRAIIKAEQMHTFIGYPEELLDDNNVKNYYRGLELDGDEYFWKVHVNLTKFANMKYVQKLRKPVRKDFWGENAYTFGFKAYYKQTENTLEVPAAVLQDYLFDPDRPQYLNYGAIGKIIGHEITHGFDNGGRHFDKDGNLSDWWKSETKQAFARKSQCFLDQYSNCTVPDLGINLNGVNTLAENIADNGGIEIAYRGYLKWLERNRVEPSLPGLRYTPRQLFWISSATNWCVKRKKEALKNFVTGNTHSPRYFRVMVPSMNSEHFGRDFNCPLGSPMNPKYKCRMW
ncbi:hypothetical protein Zmor_013639 [Zophobas morio]|uniref:Uncharacterized protein n=1 Tax=Zophobas morio TaxID=2755281 RepID=A0AA38IDV0_9CUCU|nr:hypothetical protein Zmor_013639 [Zophobas morio]